MTVAMHASSAYIQQTYDACITTAQQSFTLFLHKVPTRHRSNSKQPRANRDHPHKCHSCMSSIQSSVNNRLWLFSDWLWNTSAVTIIVVTIFIATFQNYRIVFLSRYFLCVWNDIFARHLRYANIIDSPPVYSSFSFNHASITCRERRDAWLPPGDRGWAASQSVKDAATAFEVTCRWWSPRPEPSLWRHS